MSWTDISLAPTDGTPVLIRGGTFSWAGCGDPLDDESFESIALAVGQNGIWLSQWCPACGGALVHKPKEFMLVPEVDHHVTMSR